MYLFISELMVYIMCLVPLVPSDADDDDDDDDVPITLPAWPRPRGYHAQGSNIPFGESLTLTYFHNVRNNMEIQ